MTHKIIIADSRIGLAQVEDKTVTCTVTSPPYYKQRRYLPKDHPMAEHEIGQEKTPALYIANLISVFNEVLRVTCDDGTLWVVIDDKVLKGQPLGLPWKFVFAMQESGWRFVKDIIWSKPNPTPQSVRNKPTHSHEYVFLFSKKAKYYYDQQAIRTPYAASTIPRQMRGVSESHKYSNGAPGQSRHSMSKPRINIREIYNGEATKDYASVNAQNPSDTKRRILESLMKHGGANKKSVWTVPKGSFKGSHTATFPPDLIRPCILAGSRVGDIVLDPFGGSGTTAMVALKLSRKAITCELNDGNSDMIDRRATVQSEIV
jgi:DNA modification methylase